MAYNRQLKVDVYGARQAGLTDDQIDAFVQQTPGAYRSDDTFMGKLGVAGKTVGTGAYNLAFGPEYGMFRRSKDIIGRMNPLDPRYAPETFQGEQYKRYTRGQVQQQMKAGKPLKAVGTALKALPVQAGIELREQFLPIAGEMLPWGIGGLAPGGGGLGGAAKRIAGAGLLGAGETAFYEATDPQYLRGTKTGAEVRSEIGAKAPTSAAWAMGLQGLGEAAYGLKQASKKGAEAKRAAEAAQDARTARIEQARKLGALPEDITPEDITPEVREQIFGKRPGLETSRVKQLMLSDVDVGGQHAANKLRPDKYADEMIRYGNVGDIATTGQRADDVAKAYAVIINEVKDDPRLVGKVDDVVVDALGTSRTSNIDPTDLRKARMKLGGSYAQMVASGVDDGLPPGRVELGDMVDSYRMARHEAWKAIADNTDYVGNTTREGKALANFWDSYAKDLGTKIDAVGNQAVFQEALSTKNGNAALNVIASVSPEFADEISTTPMAWTQANSKFEPWLGWLDVADITSRRRGMAFSRTMKGVGSYFGRGGSRSLLRDVVSGVAESRPSRNLQINLAQKLQELGTNPKVIKALTAAEKVTEPAKSFVQSIIQSQPSYPNY